MSAQADMVDNDGLPQTGVRRASQLGTCRVQGFILPEEVPVELTAHGTPYATMMVSPYDVEDFATGFAWTEGLIAQPEELLGVTVTSHQDGLRADLTLAGPAYAALLRQGRRAIPGRTGCGVCGVRTLDDMAPTAHVAGFAQSPTQSAIDAAVEAVRLSDPGNGQHAAYWFDASGGMNLARYDVGRHNALDKLAGARLRAGDTKPNPVGFCLITSRCSYEMVHKAVRACFSTLVALSAPTTLGVETAQEAGLRLIGFARKGEAYTFCEPDGGQGPL